MGKSLAAFLIVLAFRYSLATALMISASLAQIGEFSFILAEPWRSAQERRRPYLVVEAADSALSKMQDQRIETIMEMQCAPMS